MNKQKTTKKNNFFAVCNGILVLAKAADFPGEYPGKDAICKSGFFKNTNTNKIKRYKIYCQMLIPYSLQENSKEKSTIKYKKS